MAIFAFAMKMADFQTGMGVRRRAWASGDYITRAPNTPTHSKSCIDGNTKAPRVLTAQDVHANDWEAA